METFDHFMPRGKNYVLMLENNPLLQPFIERVKSLCVNDPSSYKSHKVEFEVTFDNVTPIWEAYQKYYDEVNA